jgi:hypothetical protein
VALKRANGALDLATMCHVETELRTARGLDKSEDALAFCHQPIDELEANETSLVARDASHARLIATRDSRLLKATSQIRSLQADVSNLVLDDSRSGPAVRVRKQYGDLKSAAATASRRRMVNVATRQHTEELMVRCKSTNVPINVSTRIDDRVAVVVDESGDGVATGAWSEEHGRWIYDDDGLPVMRALRVRDDANISNATSGKLAKCSMGVSPGQLKRAKAAFNKRLQRPVADGGHGVKDQSSDPTSTAPKARATVQVSLLSYITALFNDDKVNMGPSQMPYSHEEEKDEYGSEDVPFLDILIQGDGRNSGDCSNVHMSFCILNEMSGCRSSR